MLSKNNHQINSHLTGKFLVSLPLNQTYKKKKYLLVSAWLPTLMYLSFPGRAV